MPHIPTGLTEPARRAFPFARWSTFDVSSDANFETAIRFAPGLRPRKTPRSCERGVPVKPPSTAERRPILRSISGRIADAAVERHAADLGGLGRGLGGVGFADADLSAEGE